MSYIRKFKMGETVLSIYDDDAEVIIIESHVGMRKYLILFMASDYNERDSEHTIYLTYNPLTTRTNWIWEYNMKSYCSNTRRGKKILKENIDKIIVQRGLTTGTELLRNDLEETEQDPH